MGQQTEFRALDSTDNTTDDSESVSLNMLAAQEASRGLWGTFARPLEHVLRECIGTDASGHNAEPEDPLGSVASKT
eukprot:6530383-Pyramimonas_sp.AAC.1